MIRRCPSPRQGIREYRRGWVGFNIVQRAVIHTHSHTDTHTHTPTHLHAHTRTHTEKFNVRVENQLWSKFE